MISNCVTFLFYIKYALIDFNFKLLERIEFYILLFARKSVESIDDLWFTSILED